MFSQFQNEIIVAVVALLAIIIFLIVKKQKTPPDTKEILDDESVNKPLKENSLKKAQDIFADEEPRKPIVKEEYEEDLSGSEEGDFGEVQKIEEIEEEVPQDEVKSTIYKRDVVPHGKITKQNFSEFSGTRILIAEDNLINQKVLTGLLAGSGIETVIANDGQEALDLLENDDNFLMILMDAHMPRVDGFEATRIIRKNPKYNHILVVALSGDTAADDIKKMTEAGMAEHLEKPLRMEAFYEILYAYSGKKEAVSDNDKLIMDVIMTENLDGNKGLEICGGDEQFYEEILNEFISNYENSTQKLGDLLIEGDLEHADRVLLDIIGITANIGAQPLHDIANKIKSSLHDTEKTYLSYVDEYKRLLENLIKDIKNYK